MLIDYCGLPESARELSFDDVLIAAKKQLDADLERYEAEVKEIMDVPRQGP